MKYNRILPLQGEEKLFHLCFMKPFCKVLRASSSAPHFFLTVQKTFLFQTPTQCEMPVKLRSLRLPATSAKKRSSGPKMSIKGDVTQLEFSSREAIPRMTHRSSLRGENARLMVDYLDWYHSLMIYFPASSGAATKRFCQVIHNIFPLQSNCSLFKFMLATCASFTLSVINSWWDAYAAEDRFIV